MEELFARDAFAKRFELVTPLGTGSTIVYLANDNNKKIKVVLKFIDSPSDDLLRRTLLQSLRAALRLESPKVVKAYEVISGQTCACLVLEYIEGRTLAELIKPDTGLPFDEAISILKSVCRGLADIHSAGLVHRDLKLDNVMISAKGEVKIVDLGLISTSQVVEKHADEHTWIHSAEWITGTPVYLPPEYYKSGEFDERSDLYALGALAYELITGAQPFASTNFLELVKSKLVHKIIPITERCDDCPKPLAEWVESLLKQDPKERYQSAETALAVLCQITDPLAVAQKFTPRPHSLARYWLERVLAGCDRAPVLAPIVSFGEHLLSLDDHKLGRLIGLQIFAALVLLIGAVMLAMFPGGSGKNAESYAVHPTAQTTSRSVDLKYESIGCGAKMMWVTDLNRARNVLKDLIIVDESGLGCRLVDGVEIAPQDLIQSTQNYVVTNTSWPKRTICKSNDLTDCVYSSEEEIALPVEAPNSRGIYFIIREPSQTESENSRVTRNAEVWFKADHQTAVQITALHRPITALIGAQPEVGAIFVSPALEPNGRPVVFASSGLGSELALAELDHLPKELRLSSR